VLELTSRRSPVLDQLRLHALITLAVFDRVSDRDRSERYLRQAEALAPRDWRVMHNQAILAVRDEDWPEAGRRFLGLPRRAHRYSRAPRAEPPQPPLHGMLCAGKIDRSASHASSRL
jgi:hypothetical protein